MNSENQLVKKCLGIIETQLQWGDSEDWHNDVYIELSEAIRSRTGVLLSPVTLKRIWGRIDYNSQPSITTLNTLAQFAGYQNWREFKNSAKSKSPWKVREILNENLRVIVLAASALTIVFISFYSLRSPQNFEVDASKISFTSKPITRGLPNSVVFKVDLADISSQEAVIQQSWDPTKTILLKQGQKEATGQYYYPGYFRSKLILDGLIVKEHDLFIKSEGWLGTLDYEPLPKYVPANKLSEKNLSFKADILTEIKQNEKPLVSAFHIVQDFGSISGDNFSFETSIRNIYRDKWAVCQKVNILILGTQSAIIIPFAIPGCVSEIGIMLSETYLSGKEHDLSSLGTEFFDFKSIRITVKDKRVTVFVNDTPLFVRSYSNTLGRVVGIRYRFTGAGEVQYAKLTDIQKDTIVLYDTFDTLKL